MIPSISEIVSLLMVFLTFVFLISPRSMCIFYDKRNYLIPVLNHTGTGIRAFVRPENRCHRERISRIEAKTGIIRESVRAYLANPRYLLLPTT
jgi:hypothetical protein